MIHHHLAHDACRECIEVVAVRPLTLVVPGEAKEGVVDHPGRIERVPAAAGRELAAGELLEHGVEPLDELGQRRCVARAVRLKKLGYIPHAVPESIDWAAL